MAFVLNGTTIAAPSEINESNSTQIAEHRTLDGSVNRDHFGSNKRVWVLSYRNKKKSDYDTIKTIYDNYLTDSAPVAWVTTETNYTIASTTVHVDLRQREFTVKGTNYISDFDLVLTEA